MNYKIKLKLDLIKSCMDFKKVIVILTKIKNLKQTLKQAR